MAYQGFQPKLGKSVFIESPVEFLDRLLISHGLKNIAIIGRYNLIVISRGIEIRFKSR